jgi:hypothetical protein
MLLGPLAIMMRRRTMRMRKMTKAMTQVGTQHQHMVQQAEVVRCAAGRCSCQD